MAPIQFIKPFQDTRPGMQLLISVMVVLVCFTFSMAVVILSGSLFFGIGLNELGNVNMADNLNYLRYAQIVQSIGLFVLPPFIIAMLIGPTVGGYLNTGVGRTNAASLVLLLILMIVSIPVINFLAELNANLDLPEFFDRIEQWMQKHEESAMEVTERFLKTSTLGGLLINLFMIAVIPAIGEEFFFRGVIQKQLNGIFKNPHWAIFVTSILFSAMHLQFYGFLPRLLLGVLFGYLLIWSNSIWVPVMAHFINNGFAVVVYFLMGRGIIGEEMERIGESDTGFGFSIAGFVFFVVILAVLRESLLKNKVGTILR